MTTNAERILQAHNDANVILTESAARGYFIEESILQDFIEDLKTQATEGLLELKRMQKKAFGWDK